jgi:hypothetical protein
MSTGFQQLIFGERSLTKVAGIYSTAQAPKTRVCVSFAAATRPTAKSCC